MKELNAIAAMSENRVIGKAGHLPWHIPEELKWFKNLTWGHVLIMGRKTFETIGKPLPGREIIVLSRSGFKHPGIKVISSLEELSIEDDKREYFICGGAQIYGLTLPYCRRLYLTVVHLEVEGDLFFPPFEHMFNLQTVLYRHPKFTVYLYINPDPKLLK